jgi:hypothetical protein
MLKNLVRGLLPASPDVRLAIVTRGAPWLEDESGRVVWRCARPSSNRFIAGAAGLPQGPRSLDPLPEVLHPSGPLGSGRGAS